MSSIAESSSSGDYFSKIVDLDPKQQKESIKTASADELVDLFSQAIGREIEGESTQLTGIAALAMRKISQLNTGQQLNKDQVNLIYETCKKNIHKIKPKRESKLAKKTIDFLSEIVNIDNIGEIRAFACKEKLGDLLTKCDKYIDSQTSASVFTEKSGKLIIEFCYDSSNRNGNKRLSNLENILTNLKPYMDPKLLQLEIYISGTFKQENFASFMEKHGIMITTLYIDHLPNSSDLNFFLKNCESLNSLSFATHADGFSFGDVTHLKHLERLTIIRSNELVRAPDIRGFENLRELTINNCHKIEQLPKLDGLSQLETIKVVNCSKISTLPDLSENTQLKTLLIDYCPSVTNTINFTTLTSTDLGETRITPPIKVHEEERTKIVSDLIKIDIRQATNYLFLFPGKILLSPEEIDTFIDGVERLYLPKQANKLLRLAVEIDNVGLAKKAVFADADVNFQKDNKNHPYLLLRACKYGSAQMVNFLLQSGAEAKYIGGTHEHETPLSEAMLRGDEMRDCLEYLIEKDDGFTHEAITLKHLVHKFSVSLKFNIEGMEFRGEGFRPRYVVDDFVKKNQFFYHELRNEILSGEGKILDSFSEEAKDLIRPLLLDPAERERLAEILEKTFSSIEHSVDYDATNPGFDGESVKHKILADLGDGKPVTLFGVTGLSQKWVTGGAGLHSWGLVLMKDPESGKYLVHRCNRGYGASIKTSGILLGKFDEDQMLEIVAKYQTLSDWKVALSGDSERFFLELEGKFFDEREHIKQTSQGIGNCCYYSLQSIELALLKELGKQTLGKEAGITLAREIKRVRTAQMRIKDLQDYLTSHYPGSSKYPVDWNLLEAIYKKTIRKQKLHRYNAIILDFVLRNVEKSSQSQEAGPSAPSSSAGTSTVIPKIFTDLASQFDTDKVRKFISIILSGSNTEVAKAREDLNNDDVELLIKLQYYLPITKEKLALGILKDYSKDNYTYLLKLGFFYDEAKAFCKKHGIKKPKTQIIPVREHQ